MEIEWVQNNKLVKHQDLFQACNDIVTKHDMLIYWKKFCGHSWQPGQDKDYSDQTDALAKAGVLHGDPWSFEPSPSVSVITRHQHARAVQNLASSQVSISPQISNDDIITLQTSDAAI